MKRVLMSNELFDALGASKVEWGEPDTDGFYSPTVYADTTEATLRAANAPVIDDWKPDATLVERRAWEAAIRAALQQPAVQPEHWHHRCDIPACNCGRCHTCGAAVQPEGGPE